jgi:hypothetical protein
MRHATSSEQFSDATGEIDESVFCTDKGCDSPRAIMVDV